jgi:hypothetical protein
MLQSEGNMSLKNPVTPSVIDSATVRLVAQRLNQYATPGPKDGWVILKMYHYKIILKTVDCIDLAEDRGQWQAVVQVLMQVNLLAPEFDI